jgi:hypothetical protein
MAPPNANASSDYSAVRGAGGKVVVAGASGTDVYDEASNGWTHLGNEPSGYVSGMALDGQGSVWVAAQGGIGKYDRVAPFAWADASIAGLSSAELAVSEIYALAFAGDAGFGVGSDGLVFRTTASGWSSDWSYLETPQQPSSAALAGASANDFLVFAGALYHYTNSTFALETLPFDDAGLCEPVSAAFTAPNGDVYASAWPGGSRECGSGLWKRSNGVWSQVYASQADVIAFGASGDLLASTSAGLVHYDGTSWTDWPNPSRATTFTFSGGQYWAGGATDNSGVSGAGLACTACVSTGYGQCADPFVGVFGSLDGGIPSFTPDPIFANYAGCASGIVTLVGTGDDVFIGTGTGVVHWSQACGTTDIPGGSLLGLRSSTDLWVRGSDPETVTHLRGTGCSYSGTDSLLGAGPIAGFLAPTGTRTLASVQLFTKTFGVLARDDP